MVCEVPNFGKDRKLKLRRGQDKEDNEDKEERSFLHRPSIDLSRENGHASSEHYLLSRPSGHLQTLTETKPFCNPSMIERMELPEISQANV